jgi:HlyD family secretion protein
VDATGTVQAVTTVQVGTQVSGTIKALYADFNSTVRRGQVIAELEPSLFETQVAQARASLARLEADARRAAVQHDDASMKLQRARDLFGKALLAKADLDAADVASREAAVGVASAAAQIEQAKAALRQAEVNLAHTVISAPIDGIVISRNVDVGQTVAASMQAPTLFVLARDLTRMQVNASIAESDIGRIRAGQPVSFHVDAYPAQTFSGVVTQVRLEPVVQQNVVSYVTTIDVPNPDLRLKPGMTATVSVETARATGVLRVPNGALRLRLPEDVIARLASPVSQPRSASKAEHAAASGTTGTRQGAAGRAATVWVLGGNGLERVTVHTAISDGRWTAIADGDVAPGAAVVTGVTTATTAATGQSPLLPQRGRGAGSRTGSPPPGAR